MKENELRIGNWVHHNSNWSARIEENDRKEFDFQFQAIDWYRDGECTLSIENDLEPIKLTEEWVVRFGFIKKVHSFYTEFYIGNNPTDHNWTMMLTWPDGANEPHYTCYRNGYHNIKYVHQLQNLYFALTGEELTIKE